MCKKSIESVLEENASKLLGINGVAGIAQGKSNSEPCIKVYVIEKKPELMCQIPRILGGYEVIVEETGRFRALNNSK